MTEQAGWIAVCASERLMERALIPARVDGIELVVVRDAGQIYAFERACPHEQADLCRGDVRDGRLFCPRHRASFDLRDGKISTGWPSRDLRRYPARIADGQVWVDVKATCFNKMP